MSPLVKPVAYLSLSYIPSPLGLTMSHIVCWTQGENNRMEGHGWRKSESRSTKFETNSKLKYSNVQNTPLVLIYRHRQSPSWSFKFEVLAIVSYFGFRISNLPLNQSKNSVPHPLCPAVPFMGKDQFGKGEWEGICGIARSIIGATQWPSLRRLTTVRLPALRGRYNLDIGRLTKPVVVSPSTIRQAHGQGERHFRSWWACRTTCSVRAVVLFNVYAHRPLGLTILHEETIHFVNEEPLQTKRPNHHPRNGQFGLFSVRYPPALLLFSGQAPSDNLVESGCG